MQFSVRTRAGMMSWALALQLATVSGFSLRAAEDRTTRLEPLARLVQDPVPRVRLEALRALAKIPTGKSAELALSVLNQPMDPTLEYGLWLTINDLADPWIAALEDGSWSPVGREKQLEFALKSIKPEQSSRVLAQVLRKQPLTRDGQGPWLELIGTAGSPTELREVYDRSLSGGFDDAATARALKALGEASRLRKAQPGGSLDEVGKLLTGRPPAVQVEALKLGAQWKKLGAYLPQVGQLAGGVNTDPAVRAEAFNSLRAVGGPEAMALLGNLSAATQTPAIRQAAASSLAALDLGRAVPVIVDVARSLRDETAAQELWRAVLPVKGAGKAIAAALPSSGLDPAVARAGMRVGREGGRSELELVAALAKAAGLATDTQAFNTQLIRELATKAAAEGNPQRGEMVFRRPELACVTCHAIGGAGGKVGPDMTSIGASAPIDYLVESLLLPNAKIKEGYHSLEVVTKDGSEFMGTLARESATELILRNAAGAEQAIAKTDITKRDQSPNSLMPSGLLETLNERDQLDLFAFLSRLGKPGEFDASQGGVARRWYIANLVHTDVQNGQGDWPWKRAVTDKKWTPSYGRVNGQLTRELLQEATKATVWTGKLALLAATEIDVSQPGRVTFQLLCAPGPELWVDGRKIGGAGASAVELTAGRHRILLQIPPQQVPDALRLISPEAAFVLN